MRFAWLLIIFLFNGFALNVSAADSGEEDMDALFDEEDEDEDELDDVDSSMSTSEYRARVGGKIQLENMGLMNEEIGQFVSGISNKLNVNLTKGFFELNFKAGLNVRLNAGAHSEEIFSTYRLLELYGKGFLLSTDSVQLDWTIGLAKERLTTMDGPNFLNGLIFTSTSLFAFTDEDLITAEMLGSLGLSLGRSFRLEFYAYPDLLSNEIYNPILESVWQNSGFLMYQTSDDGSSGGAYNNKTSYAIQATVKPSGDGGVILNLGYLKSEDKSTLPVEFKAGVDELFLESSNSSGKEFIDTFYGSLRTLVDLGIKEIDQLEFGLEATYTQNNPLRIFMVDDVDRISISTESSELLTVAAEFLLVTKDIFLLQSWSLKKIDYFAHGGVAYGFEPLEYDYFRREGGENNMNFVALPPTFKQRNFTRGAYQRIIHGIDTVVTYEPKLDFIDITIDTVLNYDFTSGSINYILSLSYNFAENWNAKLAGGEIRAYGNPNLPMVPDYKTLILMVSSSY